MLYILLCRDKPDSLEVRMANRDAHIEYAGQADDRLKFAGPLLDDDGEMAGEIGEEFAILRGPGFARLGAPKAQGAVHVAVQARGQGEPGTAGPEWIVRGLFPRLEPVSHSRRIAWMACPPPETDRHGGAGSPPLFGALTLTLRFNRRLKAPVRFAIFKKSAT